MCCQLSLVSTPLDGGGFKCSCLTGTCFSQERFFILLHWSQPQRLPPPIRRARAGSEG